MLDWFYKIFEGLSGGWLILVLIACFVTGVLLLVKCADVFVDGASGLAHKLRIPTFVIGLTVVSFGTSAPEASVSILAALSNNGDISIGNVVGSNICNILLVLGLPAIFTPIMIDYKSVRNDIVIMIAAAILLLGFSLMISDNNVSAITLIEGVVLLGGIIAYVAYNVLKAKKANSLSAQLPHKVLDFDSFELETEEPKTDTSVESEPVESKNIWLVLLMLVIGLGGILIGGEFVTYSASNIAKQIGISELLVGLTVVAICTSLPELVTSLVAARKKENDIAVGTVVGSNIFNILFILGITSVITPLHLKEGVVIDMAIVIGLSIMVLLIAKFKGQISRRLGFIMTIGYLAYLGFLIIREFN